MHEFWVSSGHLLLDHDEQGFLRVTDDFLRAYLARPELMPPPEACAEERALHALLFADPFAPIDESAVADPDARENWGYFRTLRDALLATPNVEAAYLRLLARPVPPVMLDQLVHVILRNALHGTHDPMMARAAELMFRAQKATTHLGRGLLADAEVIEGHEAARRASPLLAMLGGEAVGQLDILSDDNASGYWERSDGHDLVIDLADLRPALARAIRVWIGHMLGIDVVIEPVARIDDPDWRWFIGLTEAATQIGNALWNGEAAAADGLLGLFRLNLPPDVPVAPAAAGRPVWLLLAADAEGMVRMKPQNL